MHQNVLSTALDLMRQYNPEAPYIYPRKGWQQQSTDGTSQETAPQATASQETTAGDHRILIHNYSPQNRARVGRYNSRPTEDVMTLCISSIPKNLNTMEKLTSHFKKYGSVCGVQVRT